MFVITEFDCICEIADKKTAYNEGRLYCKCKKLIDTWVII